MKPGFIVVSGLPASGKSTVARALGEALALPVFDKDDWLEHAFDKLGYGDANRRTQLSRDADTHFIRAAQASNGGVLVSFWHRTGMPETSGTPIEWIEALNAPTMTVECHCASEVAAERFLQRTRHPGHLDASRDPASLRDTFRQLESLGLASIGPRVIVDTTQPLQLELLRIAVKAALAQTHASMKDRSNG